MFQAASELFQPNVPEDFDAFWQEAVEETRKTPLNYRRNRRNSYNLAGFSVELLEFAGIDGRTMFGWLAIPEGAPAKSSSFLWLPAYGRESHLPDVYSTRPGFVSMSFNLHGQAAFHRETYQPSRGYFSEGIEDPRTWVFRRLFQNSMVALRVLQAQIEVDEDRLAAAGLSQGGGFALWAGAHCSEVRCVVADLPFLSAIRHALSAKVYRYPLKEVTDFAATIPLGMERIMHTVSYFDTLNQATKVRIPTLVSFGKKDPAVRPETVRAVYEAIPVKKKLVEYESGHEWNPAMVNTAREWLLENMP